MSTRLEEYANAPTATGTIIFEHDWYLLKMPDEFLNLWVGKLQADKIEFEPTTKPHISVMKNEFPSIHKRKWGRAFVGDEVTVKYSETIRNDNGFHLWIDCYSPELCQMREYFALPTLKRESGGVYLVNFHMTIGQRLEPVEPQPPERLRLTPQSHIDAETGMQHL